MAKLPKNFSTTAGTLALLLGGLPSMAQAQTPEGSGQSPQDGASRSGDMQIQDIVVTAQKRAENVQSVPIAISAFTAQTLQASGVISPVGLTTLTPGLNFTKTVAYGAPFIRGIGISFGSPGDEPPIATYIDGVYNPAFAALALSFNNVERIEVLKGPQGTLFGRNATGGLINIITRKPQQEFDGNLTVGYDNYQTLQTSAYATGGLTDKISADVAVFLQQQGRGYAYNPTLGSRSGKENVESIRSKLLFDVAPGAEILVAISYTNAFLGLGNPRVPVEGTIPLAATVGGQYSYDPRTAYAPYEPRSRLKQLVASVQADVDLGAVNFRSISSYRKTRYLNEFNSADTSLDGVAPITLNYYAQENDPVALTQEFQFLSNTHGHLEWVAGAYLQYSEAGYDPFYFGFTRGEVAAGASTKQTTRAAAVFGQATYRLDNGLSFTAGLRYNYEKKSYEATGIGGFTGMNVDTSDHWVDPSWRLSVDYKISNTTMLYASYNRGFKSGVYSSNQISSVPVSPEKLDAYEIGMKADLFDRRVRLNLSSYYYKFKNLQVFIVTPGGAGATLANAARAKIYGLEAEGKVIVTDHLTLSAGMALSHPEYESYKNAQIYVPTGTGGNSVGTADASGQQLERAPKRTFNAAVDYTVPLGDRGDLALNANFYHNGGFPWDSVGRIRENAYNTLNASATWKFPGNKYSVTVWSNNITNELYRSDVTESDFGDSTAFAPPRTIGVRFNMNF